MNKIGFSGTLDPLTNGHIWVIEEALRMADNVEIYIAQAPGKKTMFDIDVRHRIIQNYVQSRGWANVTVHIVMKKFIARFAKNRGVEYLIRGIRNSVDFEYEDLIQEVNSNMLHGCKTIFVIPPGNAGGGQHASVNLGAVSSSFVKGLIGNVGWHWEVKKLIPKMLYDQIVVDYLKKEWDAAWPMEVRQVTEDTHWHDDWFSRLIRAYSGPDRKYHNLDHIVHGISEINAWAANTNARDDDVYQLKQAFWLHDFIYGKAYAGFSDEAQSADAYLKSGLTVFEVASSVNKLILVTDHFQANTITHHLKDVMLGADLAILGQNPDVYDQYAENTQQEYMTKYTAAEYAIGRAQALSHLIAKANANTLYNDLYFFSEYNVMAITNMHRELTAIQATLA